MVDLNRALELSAGIASGSSKVFFNAATSACFDESDVAFLDETTLFMPSSYRNFDFGVWGSRLDMVGIVIFAA